LELHRGGLQIIDVTNPTNPTLAGWYHAENSSACGVYVLNGHAYTAGRGFRMFDVSNPSTPVVEGAYNTPYSIEAVHVSGNYAYAADRDSGVHIINISNPATPTITGSYNLPPYVYVYDVYVVGNFGYLASGAEGLQIIDVSNPANPTLIGSFNTPNWYPQCVFVMGSYAYVTSLFYGMQVIDVSNPTSPTLEGSCDTPDNALAVYVAGNYAYVADEDSGLQVIDVSNPANPVLVGSWHPPGLYYSRVSGVFVSGNNAFLAATDGGAAVLHIVSVTNPATPALVASYEQMQDYGAFGVFVSGNYAYVTTGGKSLVQIIDVSNPTAPILAGSYDTPGSADDIQVSGNYVYVADHSSLMILNFTPGGDIAGVTKNAMNGLHVQNVLVEAMQDSLTRGSDYSDGDGNYNILNLQPALYSVRARKKGYETKRHNDVEVVSDQTTQLNFFMTPSPPDTFLYDDFADGNADGWDTLSRACDWSVPAGQYMLTVPGEHRIWCFSSKGDINLTDYIYEADVYGIHGVDKVICFRFIDRNNFYAVNLRSDWGGNDEVTINKMQGGTFTADIFSVPYPSQNQTLYHLKVEISGTDQTNIKVWVEDNQLINWTDPGTPITHGKIAVAAYSGDYGGSTGLPTVVGFTDVLVADLTQRKVGAITIKADHFENLGDGDFKAEGNVWIEDQTGENRYLYLGADAEVTFNVNQGTVSEVVHTNVKLLVNNTDYAIDNITSLDIDAEEGLVNFHGTVHYSENASFQSSFTGDLTLYLNQRKLQGNAKFDDSFFGGISGEFPGTWDFTKPCPFFGYDKEVNLFEGVIELTGLSCLSGQMTMGVFLNTGIFRIGLTFGALEFKEYNGAFGFKLTDILDGPPGFPSEGVIDIDLAHMRVNVVKDIPIGLCRILKQDSSEANSQDLRSKRLRTDWGSLRKVDQNRYEVDAYDEKGNVYKFSLVKVGLTIKGEENYDDVNCNGVYDQGIDTFIPYNPDYDHDLDGEWDEGTNIALLNESQEDIIYVHGRATLDLKLASYFSFTCGELIVDIDYPNSTIIELEGRRILKLGNIFSLDFGSNKLSLDFEFLKYFGDPTFTNIAFPEVGFTSHLLITFDPLEFEAEINEDFQILGVDIFGAGTFLRVEEDLLCQMAHLNAFTLLDANGKLIWKDSALDGFFNSDFCIDGFHLQQWQNEFHFAPGECMSVSASGTLCPIPGSCLGGKITFRICSLWDWSVTINGKYISLKCPANLHVYDSQGRHTGLNQSGGIDLEIPGSEFYFSQDSSMQLIFIPGFDLSDVYTIDVQGESTGVIDVDVLYPNPLDSKLYDFTFFDEPTQQGALHRVVLDSTNNWTMLNDLNGDGIFETQAQPDSTAEATLDTTMVTITNVASEIICANDAKITWKTNVPATSEVLYRSQGDSAYKSVSDTTLTTSHSVIVNNILTTDTYYYIPVSVDTSGNIASFLEKSFKLEYLVGDVNSDGFINVVDVVYLVNYLFINGPAPDPVESGDANCDHTINAADVVYLINYLYIDGPPPGC
jgi:hypothetical protein